MRAVWLWVVVLLSGAVRPGGPVLAGDFVWRVRGGGGTLYLGGSIHELRTQDRPLPASFEFAYAQSDQVAFEADLEAAAGAPFQARVLTKARYPGRKTLAAVLNDATYQRVRHFAIGHGLAPEVLGSYQPWLAAEIVSALSLHDAGFSEVNGVDRAFLHRAFADGKPRLFLESVSDQVELLAGMPESETILRLEQALDSEVADALDLLKAWKAGDAAALDALTQADRANAPVSFDRLLRRRNQRWLPRIREYLDQPNVTFAIVGAAHLVGTNGLVHLLENQGLEVWQLPCPPPTITYLGPGSTSPAQITDRPKRTDSTSDSLPAGTVPFNFGSSPQNNQPAPVGQSSPP
jgi:uncharacterized protein YbaP (TraB family)